MNQAREQLIAYLATLAALILVFTVAVVAGAMSPGIIGKIEAFGLGTITGGLIGVLRLPQQRSVTVDNSTDDPVPTTKGRT